MKPFRYQRPDDLATALTLLGAPATLAMAGGTEVVNWMKTGLAEPDVLIDLSDLPLGEITGSDDGVRIGALARLADVARHPDIRAGFPAVVQAIESGASPQLRNLATVGGNLLQRTRCEYFRSETPVPCNKRSPGAGCAARTGLHRHHAIMGASEHCVATHPSDLAVALAALDARVLVQSSAGPSSMAMAEFYRLPGDTPERDTGLPAGSLVVAIEIPSRGAVRSAYVKVRERASFEFALVAAAASVERDRDRLAAVRIALGGVAARPWRLYAAETALTGSEYSAAGVDQAVAAALTEARPLEQNRFKVELVRRAAVRAVEQAWGSE